MTIRMPAQLGLEAYKRPVRVENGGSIAATHLAIVADENGVDSRAFVKHFEDQSPRGLFNEWFGTCLMSALGVPHAKGALLPAPIGGTGPVRWAYASFTPGPDYDGTPKEIYDFAVESQCKELVARLMACHSFAGMVAADQLCMNADRNLGNLVFTGKKSFVVIDHGEILGGNAWSEDLLLRPTGWVRSIPLEVCKAFEPLPRSAQNGVYAGAELTSEMLWLRFLELREALEAGGTREASLALNAVWWRSLELAGWFRNELQLV